MSLNSGAVWVFCSKEAAHNAAPTVFVNAKMRFANGTISNTDAAMPKLRESDNLISIMH